jgi:hypothetical protein
MPSDERVQKVEQTTVKVSYEAPALTVLGNLRDLLAGGGSQDCDGNLNAQGPNTGTC